MGDKRLRPRSYDSCFLVWVSKSFWSLAVLISVVFFSLGQILGHYLQLTHDILLLQHFLFIFVTIPLSDAIEEPNWKVETNYPEARSYQKGFFPRTFQSIICSHTAIRSYIHTIQLLKSPNTVLMVHFQGFYESKELILFYCRYSPFLSPQTPQVEVSTNVLFKDKTF
jgi:hypothetical protein